MMYQIFTQPITPVARPPLTSALIDPIAPDTVAPPSVLPPGGLWTSSYDPPGISAWAQWWWHQPTPTPVRHWVCEVRPGVRMFAITGPADLQALLARFPDPRGTGVHWGAVAAHYDGVHVRPSAVGQLVDCPTEATLWFRWAFSRHQLLGLQVPERDPRPTAEPAYV